MSEMPKWPSHVPNKKDDWEDMTYACMEYERARAEAAIQRLRVAVEALKRYANVNAERAAPALAREALAAIGEVPK